MTGAFVVVSAKAVLPIQSPLTLQVTCSQPQYPAEGHLGAAADDAAAAQCWPVQGFSATAGSLLDVGLEAGVQCAHVVYQSASTDWSTDSRQAAGLTASADCTDQLHGHSGCAFC